jgi:hypothetical protein
MKKELHIMIGCADARDLSQVQLDVIAQKSEEYRQNGIEIFYQNIRTAGSFITDNVYGHIKTAILEFQKKHVFEGDDISCYIHIQTHGELTSDSSKEYIGHIFQMKIQDGSPLNCGMLNATGVSVEIEQMIIENQLQYNSPHGPKKIHNDNDIRSLLRDIYAYDGYLAGDWIRSIDFLRTHPRRQKARLENLAKNDPDLNRLHIKITAGFLDYSIHSLVRLDSGIPHAPWWDDVQLEIRKRISAGTLELSGQGEKQKPLAGLICMPDPSATSRSSAAEYYLKSKKIVHDGYLPNTIFNMTGSTFDIPYRPFGPYEIAGYYYAVKHLGLTDQMVMGHEIAQTNRILMKIKYDPIMNLITTHFRVNLIPVNQVDIAA